MKTYPESILDAPETPVGLVSLPSDGPPVALLKEFSAFAPAELLWIARTVKQVRQSDHEDVLDRLYRRGHVVSGLAQLLRLPRVDRLLSILDLVLDLGRDASGFESHSMGYLVALLVDTSVRIIDELESTGQTTVEIADLIGECRVYLAQPLAMRNAPPLPVRAEPAAVASPPKPVPDPEAIPAESADIPPAAGNAGAEGLDDAPEDLDIPADKVTFIADFCEEARQSVGVVGRSLIELETAASPGEIVNDLFRNVHTVKGGARLLKISRVEAISHAMENLLDQVRKGTRTVTPVTIDVLMDCTHALESLLDQVAAGGPLSTPIRPLIEALNAVSQGVAPAVTPGVAAPPARAAVPAAAEPPAAGLTSGSAAQRARMVAGGESIRVPAEKLDEVLNTASEIYIGRLRLQSELAALDGAIQHFKKALQQMAGLDATSIVERLGTANRRVADELRHLLNRSAGAVPQDRLETIIGRFREELQVEIELQQVSNVEEITLNVLSIEEIRKRFQRTIERLEQLSSRLQTGAMNFRMVPVSQLFGRFPSQVRDLARQLGKKVRLEISGEDTELDKVLITKLGDPLIHILRNSIDHGIEEAGERSASGKAEVARITLRASYQGAHVVIEVTDDGRGIDRERVLSKAVASQLVTPERAASLTPEDVLELLFEPGFSTAGKVSELSGRGVGMDVVRTAVNQLQGSVTIESRLGHGTSIRIKLPLTLAVVGILLVEEGANQFAFPILNVEDILKVDRAQVLQVSGGTVYNHRGTTLPVTTLSKLLHCPSGAFAEPLLPIVILTDGDRRICVVVDAVLGKQDVLIKNLGDLVKNVPFVMGCTILSDSRLVLILNAWEVVNKATRKSVATDLQSREQGPVKRREHTVLVVDDSPIQRKSMSSVITQAGYRAETVENGFEGLKAVRRRRYSVYCVDVLMPLMDGFEFVDRLRRVPGNSEAPVFFITARTTDADRDRAAGAGVVEYFNKPVDADRLIATLDRYCLGPAGASDREPEGPKAVIG